MNETSIQGISSSWVAAPCPVPSVEAARLSPLSIDDNWHPLHQAWVPGEPEPGFHPGWAQVHWSPGALHFGAVFIGSTQQNRARVLNERTWELGDVCEFFVQVTGNGHYLELHVTPENQRLQLLWPADGLERFRRDESPLRDFLIPQADWVQSSTRVGPGFWAVDALIPWSCLGVDPAGPLPAFRAAVCRYDYGGNSSPTYSSTAPLRAPNFHRTREWQSIALSSEGR